VLDPYNQNIMYLAGGSEIWRNLNVSQIPRFTNDPTEVNWDKFISTNLSENEQVSALGISLNPRGVLYAGTTVGNLLRIGEAHTNQPIVENIRSFTLFRNAYISCIAVDKRSSRRLILVVSNYNRPSVYWSQDGGETFQDVSGNLEEFPDGSGNGPSVRWVDIVPLSDGGSLYLAGTSEGLWSTTELRGLETVWQQEGEEVIGNSVVTMIKSRTTDGKVVVATHGNGIFESQIENVEPLDVPIDVGSEVALLEGPIPNPLTSQTRFRYTLPETGPVRVRIFDLNGALVRDVIWATQFEGINEATWDGTKEGGDRVTSGMYIYRFEYRDQIESGRVLVK
jgi:hypothetical protein